MKKLILSLAVIVPLTACFKPNAMAEGLQLIPKPFTPELNLPQMVGEVEVLSVHQLTAPERWFGGLSGSHFDGETFWAVNDSGHFFNFPMRVDEAGVPVQVGKLSVSPLGGLDGSKFDGDAEELLRLPDGWLVSFERRHRLFQYKDLAKSPQAFATPQGFSRQPSNGGVEALAYLPKGNILALSEEGGEQDLGSAWLWIAQDKRWANLTYKRTEPYKPTGAVTLPNGDVLVTERRFSVIGGVGLRLVVIPKENIAENAVMIPTEIAQMAPPMAVDNYESVSVFKRNDGRLVAYILSDDNFNLVQSTLLLTVLLPLR